MIFNASCERTFTKIKVLPFYLIIFWLRQTLLSCSAQCRRTNLYKMNLGTLLHNMNVAFRWYVPENWDIPLKQCKNQPKIVCRIKTRVLTFLSGVKYACVCVLLCACLCVTMCEWMLSLRSKLLIHCSCWCGVQAVKEQQQIGLVFLLQICLLILQQKVLLLQVQVSILSYYLCAIICCGGSARACFCLSYQGCGYCFW